MLVVLLAVGTLIPGGVGARMKVVVVGNWRGSKQQEGPTADQVTCPDLGDLPNNTSYPSAASPSTRTNTSNGFWDLTTNNTIYPSTAIPNTRTSTSSGFWDLPHNTIYLSTSTSAVFCDLPLTKLPLLQVLSSIFLSASASVKDEIYITTPKLYNSCETITTRTVASTRTMEVFESTVALQTASDQSNHVMRLVFSLQILLDLGPDQSATRPIPIPTNQSTCMLSKNMRGAKNEIAGHFNVDAKVNLNVNLNANQMPIYRSKMNVIFNPDFSANFSANLNINFNVNLNVNLNH